MAKVARLEIDPVRTALVLLDLQNYNVHPDGYWNQAMPGAAKLAEPMIEGTVRALETARAAGITVIHVANSWREGHPDVNLHAPWMREAKEANRSIDGSWGVEFSSRSLLARASSSSRSDRSARSSARNSNGCC
jgi:nicotinamidase-related amidase